MSEELAFTYDVQKATAIIDMLRDLREHWYLGFTHSPQLVVFTLAASNFHMVHDEVRSAITSFMREYNVTRSCFRIRKERLPEHRMVIIH